MSLSINLKRPIIELNKIYHDKRLIIDINLSKLTRYYLNDFILLYIL